MYHGAMGAMQGMTLTQIYDRIADVLMDTQKAQWVRGVDQNDSRREWSSPLRVPKLTSHLFAYVASSFACRSFGSLFSS